MYIMPSYTLSYYGITIWGSASNTLLIPLHILQNKFHKLNLLPIFDIYKIQVGKLVYDFPNNIGPTKSIIQFTITTEVHTHSTHYGSLGTFYGLELLGLD